MKTRSLFLGRDDTDPASADEKAALARQARYSVATLAKMVGCSCRQLQRDCKCWLQTTPRCWLEALRWAEALRLLQTDLPLKEISDRLGYRRSEHFSRAFQRVHGLSPSAFRAGKAECREMADFCREMAGLRTSTFSETAFKSE